MIVEEEWRCCEQIRREVALGPFVLMPDHMHGIVMIAPPALTSSNPNGELTKPQRLELYRHPRSLGSLVAGFKSSTSRRINRLRNSPGAAVWQRNYHEHVIRSDRELTAITEYIQNNPLRAALKGRS